jgi:hypothetical protein
LASPSDAYAVAVFRHPVVPGFRGSSSAVARARLAAGLARLAPDRVRFVFGVFAVFAARPGGLVFFATCASPHRVLVRR